MVASVASAQTGDAVALPAVVQKAFQQAYPTATVVRMPQERDGDRPRAWRGEPRQGSAASMSEPFVS